MSSLKRWLHKYGREFKQDGTIKDEVRKKLLAQGMSELAVDNYAARIKAKYDHFQLLDQISSEELASYTAWDLWSESDKQRFHPDGSLKPQYINFARLIGISEAALAQMERQKKIEVNCFNHMSDFYAQQGINFGEMEMRSRSYAAQNYGKNLKQMRQDLGNVEPMDVLPLDIDPDDYYHNQGDNLYAHNSQL